MNKPTLGVIVGNRGFFPAHLCEKGRERMLKVLEEEGINAVALTAQDTKFGSIESVSDAQKCADLFKKHKNEIDGVLVTLPNFGDERAIANAVRWAGLDVPLLMQAYPDDPAKMTIADRRDSFCGKMSACNNLKQYGIPYTLTSLHTVDPESAGFRADLRRFVGACRVVRGLRGARIGCIGARPAAFLTVRYSEKLLEASGISVETIDLSEIFGKANKLRNTGKVKAKLEALKSYVPVKNIPDEALVKMAKFGVVVDDWMADNALVASAVQCWTSMEEYYGVVPCAVMSMMSNTLMPSACETDIPGVVGMYAMALASGKPSALIDWNNNYGADPDKCVIFHCSNLPRDIFKNESIKPNEIPVMDYQEIIAGTVGRENTYGTIAGRVRAEPFTFCRVSTDDLNGGIASYLGEGELTNDPLTTFGGYGVAHIPNMQRLMHYICDNGFEHHAAINLSRCAGAVYEAFGTYMGWDVYYHAARKEVRVTTHKYAIGVDFGTESGRAMVVDVSDGKEVASFVHQYANGVIDEMLPGSNMHLEPDWALQDPNDYIEVFKVAIPGVLKQSGVSPADVVGLGVDFTACTMMPTTKDGTPLCLLPEWRNNPHAWVKLWKHHAAQPEANKLNEIAQAKGFTFLQRYGGKISSEWFFPKAWQILNEAPEVYAAADRLIEGADWVIWKLTGEEKRNTCTAGYKALWSKREGFPPAAFFKALDPRLEHIVDEKMTRTYYPLGAKAGGLTAEAATWTGLAPGTAVAVGNVDAHVAVPAATVVEPERMVIIMGTSNCHMVMSTQEGIVPGMCGYVEDGIVPGFFGYEAGQSCVGDHFAWFVENCAPSAYQQEAERRKLSIHQVLEEKAARLQPGESGLVALDWWNGNRSVLVDVELSGMLLGATLATKAEDIYRALIEATAYGTRMIIDTFKANHVPVKEIIATGGLPDRNKLLMQMYSDVTGLPIKVAATHQGGALGSAMHGAVAAGKAAGGYDTIQEAAAKMARLRAGAYKPNAANHEVYNLLFAEYVTLHDYFGRGANDAMKRLKKMRAGILAGK